ncbi:MAG: hypothetical protein QF785_01320 [Phycisphaeraceae bacterium]|jgi:hypothetical protein|nr:hypothetical protein [Phycisphaeraceae bacterium]
MTLDMHFGDGELDGALTADVLLKGRRTELDAACPGNPGFDRAF